MHINPPTEDISAIYPPTENTPIFIPFTRHINILRYVVGYSSRVIHYYNSVPFLI